MAEGGKEIPLDPLGPDMDEDEDEDEPETSFGGDDWDTHSRSSGHYFNQDEETIPLIDSLERRLEDKEKAEDFLRSVFVDPRVDQLLCGVDEYDRVWVSLKNKGAAKYVHQPSGRFLSKSGKEIPKTLKDALGQSYDEALGLNDHIMEQNGEALRQLNQAQREIQERKERFKDLEKQNKKLNKTIIEKEKVVGELRTQLEKSTSPSKRERLDEEIRKLKSERSKNRNTMRENNAEIDGLRQQMENGENQEEVQQQIERLEAENERLGEQNEEIFSRMSLRDKVKYIFKKYGLTIFGVLAAVGTSSGS